MAKANVLYTEEFLSLIKKRKVRYSQMMRTYTEVDIAQCWDDTTAKSNNERAIGHQHELCCRPYCDPSGKSGILDVNLRNPPPQKKSLYYSIFEVYLLYSVLFLNVFPYHV